MRWMGIVAGVLMALVCLPVAADGGCTIATQSEGGEMRAIVTARVPYTDVELRTSEGAYRDPAVTRLGGVYQWEWQVPAAGSVSFWSDVLAAPVQRCGAATVFLPLIGRG